MGFLGTIGVIGGILGLLNTLFGKKPKAPKFTQETFRAPEEYVQSFVVDPTKRFMQPFSTMEEQLLFQQRQEDLLNLRLYRPRDKLGE